MLVGLDSYCFHRYFGEIYGDGLQVDPGTRWDMKDDFVPYALSLGIDEVALESCFFPALDNDYCDALKDALDAAGMPRILGWGHPDGLHAGTDDGALGELKAHIPQAQRLGCSIMRIVASSMIHVKDDHAAQVKASVAMLKDAVRVAEDHGITLAIENHIDFTSTEILDILDGVGSDNLRVNLDTGNALRLYEDPVEAARNLAPVTVSTHTKDIRPSRGGAPSEHFTWWPSCPAGEGLVDLVGVAAALHAGGFTGSLALEVDLIAAPWNARPEEELVETSIAYLKSIAAQYGRKEA
jgi:sugar phosphate isomerase/epimerase